MSAIVVPHSSTATISNCTFISNSTSTSTSAGTWYTTTGSGYSTALSVTDNKIYDWIHDRNISNELLPGTIHKLPDGSKLVVDFNGNYEIIDYNAKVTYKSNNIREFNKFVNSSDVLEDFIRDVGKLGVKQKDVFSLPIELFINWLIVKAAEKDGEDIDFSGFKKQISKLLLPA